ncbi:MAG: EAL domain-containing protein [Gammaproteobacteria bacterium]|nr:EAL domain-containing protein [Gammaproteobacteria bacterium]
MGGVTGREAHEESLRQRAERMLEPMDGQAELGMEEVKQLLHDLRVHQIELEMQNEELRATQGQLQQYNDKYSTLYDFAPVGYCTLDANSIILECNYTLTQLLAVNRERLLRYPFGNFVKDSQLPVLKHLLGQEDREVEQQLTLKTKEGEEIFTLLRFHRLSVPGQSDAHWLVAVSDVTRLHQLTVELAVKGRAIESTQEAVVISNHRNEICYVNPAFEETTGYSSAEVVGRKPQLLQSGKHTKSFYEDMWQTLHQSGGWRGEIWNRRANGEVYPEWLSISVIYDDLKQPLYYVGVFTDITHEEQVRQRLHQLAYHDATTGLPNRHLFMDRLQQAILHSRRSRSGFSLLFMDLDRFKTINDTLGHTVGDELLTQVGQRIELLIRDSDTVARMGGDEFIILLPEVIQSAVSSQMAQKILEEMAKPFKLAGRPYQLGISIGISIYPQDGGDAETLIKHADIAMYRSKSQGRNTYHTYDPALDLKVQERVTLENDLRHAFNHEQLQLVYQPQVDLESGRWVGAEALLRWNHPQRGFISPAEFIPIAEECGLIVQIGYWVLRTAARQYLQWQSEGVELGTLSVNLSPHQFLQGDLLRHIREILEDTGMPPAHLGIEVTESAAMPNFEYSITILKKLQEMGVRIDIDDFGSGFSSLSHLRHLPIDTIKIDRQFIDEIPSNPDDVAIARAIIAMAQSLNLEMIAEGIETAEQLAFVKDHGCQTGQGYLFAKPMAAKEICRQFVGARNGN